MCKLCYENNSDAVLMDWGHGGIWHNWACILAKNDNRCFLWRSIVNYIIQVKSIDNLLIMITP